MAAFKNRIHDNTTDSITTTIIIVNYIEKQKKKIKLVFKKVKGRGNEKGSLQQIS